MNISNNTMKPDRSAPSAGLLLIASPRFKNLGEGTERGPYRDRKQVDAERRLKAFGGAIRAVFPGIVYEQEDIRKAVALFREERVDFIYAEFLSWSEDAAWVEFLREDLDIPILFAHVVREEPGFSDTNGEDDFIEFLSAGALVGALEGSGDVARAEGKTVKTVVGGLDSVIAEAKTFGLAAAARAGLKRSKLGLAGNYNELMWSTYIDPYKLFTKLGPTIHFISYSDLALETGNVSDADAMDYVKRLRGLHETLPDVDEGKFAESARASLALARIAERMGLNILALNDVDHALFRAIGLRPGFYPEWFNENGAVMVPEGDVGAGMAAYLLKRVSGRTVNFIEPFYIDRRNGTFAAGHAGPNDHTEMGLESRVKIARDVRFAKTSYKFAGAPFAWIRFAPGLKTMVHISERNGVFKIVCALAEALDGEHFLASYSHGMFRPRIPVEELFGRIVAVGATQHFVMADGDWRGHLRTLADISEMEFHCVDEGV